VLDALAASGRLDETIVLFTSDNGLLMGQHRVVARKASYYEECVRVPLLVRGPGVPRGAVVDAPVLNVDLAPTIAALAGLQAPPGVDGRSVAAILRGAQPSGWRTEMLLEGVADDGSMALRTAEWLFAEHGSGELELYDMRVDPWQLESQHRAADPALVQSLRGRLRVLSGCRGTGCN
jgi:arylsulfatase A-like enzyme